MTTFICTNDVVMFVSQEIRFKAGQQYEFYMSELNEISIVTDKGVHLFTSKVWPTYFKLIEEN